MGDLHRGTEYCVGSMMERPRAGANVFQYSDWALYFFPEDIRLVVELKEKARKTRRASCKSSYEFKRDDTHQKIMESLSED